MRQDQFDKLLELQEQLIDAAILEADPKNWHGEGLKPNEMTRDTRGDRYWCKRNAVATLSLVMRINSLSDQVRRASATPPAPDGTTPAAGITDEAEELEAEVVSCEKEAQNLLKRLQDPKSRKEFKEKALGKS